MLSKLIGKFSALGLHLWGPFGVLLLCGLGLPLPEDIVLVSAGYLGAQHHDKLIYTCTVMMAGVLIGDSIIFFIGRMLGYNFLWSTLGKKIFRPSAIEQAQRAFEKYGFWVLFIGRFLPGLRAPIFFCSGALRYTYIFFLLFDASAAVISVPMWVAVGHWGFHTFDDLGDIERLIKKYQSYLMGAAVIVVISLLIFLYHRFRKKKSSHVDP